MDRAALRELFDYTEFTWASYERSLRSLPNDALTRTINIAGRPTLGHALFHLAAAWDGWLKHHAGPDLSIPDIDDEFALRDVAAIQQYRSSTRAVIRQLIDSTDDEVLNAVSEDLWHGEDGQPRFHASPAEVVAHILLHERGHHGDITTIFTAMGAEPPPSDYLIYLFFLRNKR